jgi:hypothetical protein
MFGSKRQRLGLVRFVGLLLGCAIIARGALRIVAGQPNYENHWGGMVFAPFGIFLGAFLVYLSLARPEALIARFSRRGRHARR